MEQILSVYGFLKETVITILMLYKNMKEMVPSPDGDTNFFDNGTGDKLSLPNWLGLWITQTASLQKAKTPNQWVSWYDTKLSDSEVLVMLELWGMQSTSSLPLLTDPLWPGIVAPDSLSSHLWVKYNCSYSKLNLLK